MGMVGIGFAEETPTLVPSPQGGGRPSQSTFANKYSVLAVPSSPSPLWGGDRGGGLFGAAFELGAYQ
jgi:hypothetical protein